MIRRRSAPRSGPGLAGTMARTAVIAGTATAVSGNVHQRQVTKAQAAQSRQQAAQEQQQATIETQAEVQQMRQQMEALQAQQAQAAIAPTPAAPADGDLIAQLKQLGDLKAAGILNDAEFEAAKAKLLGM